MTRVRTALPKDRSSVDSINQISSLLKSGADGTLITGTAGADGNIAQWNADGDLIEYALAAANIGVATGDVWTGVHDFGEATSLEIPNSATPTVNSDGEVAVDTAVADFSHGVIKFYAGEELGVVAMPIAEFTTPTDGHVVAYNAANDEFELVSQASGSGDLVSTNNLSDVASASTAFGNIKQAASDSATGVVELATVSETTAGTDAARAVTPDGLAGSVFGTQVVTVQAVNDGTNVTVGDGAGELRYRIPSTLNAMNLVGVAACVQSAGTTGTLDIQIHNVTQAADMLTTKLTIDSGETDSSTAATPAVIDTANDDVATGDQLRIDIDAVQTTPPAGLTVEMQFRLP